MTDQTKDLPKISIVMPSWNAVDFIERSIRSVVEQDYPHIELVIQDGLSKDGTVEIIKHYAKKYPKIIKWKSEKDKGQADAINQGMKKITGDIVTYLNADDVYKPGALRLIGEYFVAHPKTMWVYGKCDIIDGDDKAIRGWITAYKNFWLQHYSYSTLLILNYISQMACFWRKEAAEKVGEFDVNQYLVLDYDYWLRLGEHFPAGVIPKYLASFRITANNKSSVGFLKQFKDELEVSKRFTKNPVIIGLHNLNYLGIISIYSFLRYFNKLSRG
jgi:glycosyltransferase involved in cell wall biosynthesis